jgi:hypothetical protein
VAAAAQRLCPAHLSSKAWYTSAFAPGLNPVSRATPNHSMRAPTLYVGCQQAVAAATGKHELRPGARSRACKHTTKCSPRATANQQHSAAWCSCPAQGGHAVCAGVWACNGGCRERLKRVIMYKGVACV